MFYVFTTETTYPEEVWPTLWEIENRIASLIMSESENMKDLAALELETIIRDDFSKRSDFPSHALQPYFVPSLLDEFLASESEAIRHYIENLPAQDPTLVPKQMLKDCIDSSQDFHYYVRAAGKDANAFFREKYGDE